jgi:uncharacterized phiE125 gp8 family phage protein
MALKRITAPSTQCVTVDEVKDFLRLQGTTSEDYLLQSFIKAAESYAENYMKRSISKQQWELRLDEFPDYDESYKFGEENTYEIELPRPPLTTVSSEVEIKYIDPTAGTTATVASTAFTIDYNSEPGIVYPSYDNNWPEARDERNAVRITYYSGYSNPTYVPEAIKQWVKLRVGAMYENRESLMVGAGNFITELPHSYVDGLLDEFVVQSV